MHTDFLQRKAPIIYRRINSLIRVAAMSSQSTDKSSLAARERMRRHRERGRLGLRCVTIELRETEIELLIARRWLAKDMGNNSEAVVEGPTRRT
jgi:hypothetical protein